ESTRRTPRRMAEAFIELLSPAGFDLTTFPNERGYRQLVLERDIPFTSLCEHHMMPFRGTAHVGYLPGARMLGLSKLARVVDLFARRPQVQVSRAGFCRGSEPTLRCPMTPIPAGRSRPRTRPVGPGRSRRATCGG